MAITYRTSKSKDGCRRVFAYDGQKMVGWMSACSSGYHLEVQSAFVAESHQRQKIGTALYTRLAKIACEIGEPLASYSWQRSAMSEGFWQKQLKLDRAYVDPKRPKLAVIKCPVPPLTGRRRRR